MIISSFSCKKSAPCSILLKSAPYNSFTGCTDGDIRLAEGNTLADGRVELCRNDIWGTVCSNGMDVEDARVVCRQLGFSIAGKSYI